MGIKGAKPGEYLVRTWGSVDLTTEKGSVTSKFELSLALIDNEFSV